MKNIISDWLEKHGDPKITEQVKKEAELLNKQQEMEIGFDDQLWDDLPEPTRCINEPLCEVREWDLEDGGKVVFAPTEESHHEYGKFYLKNNNGSTAMTIEEAKQKLIKQWTHQNTP